MKKEMLINILNNPTEEKLMFLNLYFASLISSDTCIDIESSELSLDKLIELRTYLEDSSITNNELREKYLDLIDKGYSIVTRDIRMYENGGILSC